MMTWRKVRPPSSGGDVRYNTYYSATIPRQSSQGCAVGGGLGGQERPSRRTTMLVKLLTSGLRNSSSTPK